MKISKRFWKRPIHRIKRDFADLARGYERPNVVSFPKSGRTWLELMLDNLGIEAEFTHDNAGHLLQVPFTRLEPAKVVYRRRRVVFLMRDPRDVVVSGYFQATKRLGVYAGNISDFIRDERHGIEKTIRFNQAWLTTGPNATKDFFLVTYENLRRNTLGQLKKIVDFVGCPGVSDAAMEQAVLSTQIDKLRELERSGAFREKYGAHLTPGDVDDPESYKVRKGKIGGFVEYLNPRDIAFCEEKMQRLGFDAWYPLEPAQARNAIR